MEVAPTIHYIMGGVRVDAESCASNVPGLYAAGEVSAGLHGANRLGGNSLTDLLVFGRRAGEAAAASAKSEATASKEKIDPGEIDSAISSLMAPLDRPAADNPFKIMGEVQDTLSKHAPIVRDEATLKEGLDKIMALHEVAARCGTGGSAARAFNPGWHTTRDLGSMLVNAEALFRSAIARKESRGAHARSDFPKTDDQLAGVNFVVDKTADGMRLRSEPKHKLPGHLMDAVDRSYARYTPEETE
jgi:succinate dehydrogenase / fumarate reductase flavoprotein subunit